MTREAVLRPVSVLTPRREELSLQTNVWYGLSPNGTDATR